MDPAGEGPAAAAAAPPPQAVQDHQPQQAQPVGLAAADAEAVSGQQQQQPEQPQPQQLQRPQQQEQPSLEAVVVQPQAEAVEMADLGERKANDDEAVPAGGDAQPAFVVEATIASPSPSPAAEDTAEGSGAPEKPARGWGGYANAGWLSRVTTWFMTELIYRGSSTGRLDLEDLPELAPSDLSAANSQRFAELWQEELAQPVPSLWRAVRRLGGSTLTLAFTLAILTEVVQFAGPMLVKYMVNWVDDPDATQQEGWILTALLFAVPLIQSILRNNHAVLIWRVSVRVRAALVSTIFQKEMGSVDVHQDQPQPQAAAAADDDKKSPNSKSSGKSKPKPKAKSNVVNLISTDEQKFREFWPLGHFMLTSPISIIVSLVLLWFQLDFSTLAGFAIIILALPFNGYLAKGIGVQRQKEAVFCDQRLKLARQVLGDIRTIKAYGWTSSFLERMSQIRARELKERRSGLIYEALMHCAVVSVPVLITVVTFTVFTAAGGELTAERIFVSIAYLNIMRFQLNTLPRVIAGVMELQVSLQRIQAMFVSQQFQQAERSSEIRGDILVELRGATLSWGSGRGNEGNNDNGNEGDGNENGNGGGPLPVLRDVDLAVRQGSLVCVVGEVASGKSSLLASVLGELRLEAGERYLAERIGRIGLFTQVPWLQNATVRDNILFGRPFDQERYREVTRAAALLPDFREWSDGDLKMVSSGASSLSGGQRSRVALARALYADCEHLYLLDDPLSAVDAQVSEHLWFRCVVQQLVNAGKTVVIALNQLQYLPMADHVVVLRAAGGCGIECQGPLDQLIAENPGFREMLARHGYLPDRALLAPAEERARRLADFLAAAEANAQQQAAQAAAALVEAGPGGEAEAALVEAAGQAKEGASPTAAAEDRARGNRGMQAEQRSFGSIKWSVYVAYASAAGGIFMVLGLLQSFILHNVGRVGMDWWLALWADDKLDNRTATLVLLFACMGLAVILNSLLRSMLFAQAITLSARRLHENFAQSLFRAQARFFDTTPIGAALNRFSSDFDRTDHLLGRLIEGYGGSIFFVFGCVAALCVIFGWIFIAPMAVLMFIYWRVQRWFVMTSRELQRLDNISRSPVFNQLQEAIDGRSVLRAFREYDRFVQDNYRFLDTNHAALFYFQSSLAWLDNFVSLIGALVSFACGVFIVEGSGGDISSSMSGMALSNCFILPTFCVFTVRLWSTLESEFTSVERICEFTDVPQEAPHHIEAVDAPLRARSWPAQGGLEFRGVGMRYAAELPPVLQDVTFSVRPGERVAVVGRTGSGKSSLVSAALFRLVELETGTILIDGQDVRQLGLELLRSRLTVIPQDALLFQGSLRYNLDPFDQYSDAQVWGALRMVGLDRKALSLAVAAGVAQEAEGAEGPNQPSAEAIAAALASELAPDGSTWSAGERQLLCIGRAALRCVSGRSRVLVLDEATSSTDAATDAKIQEAIRGEAFRGVTVLTVAHRLLSIMDYDRVLCMDAGRVALYDSPHRLLQLGPGTLFYDLVAQTGELNAAHLAEVARRKHEQTMAGAAGVVAVVQEERKAEGL